MSPTPATRYDPRLAQLLPYLNHAVAGAEERVVARAVKLLQDGKLTPEGALQLWMEVAAARDVLRRLGAGIKMSAVTEAAAPLDILPNGR
jgi:hypothetical protein